MNDFNISINNKVQTLAERIATHDMSVVVECHKTKQHGPFASFSFAYIHPDPSANASAAMVIDKNKWVRVCIHFSDEKNVLSPNPEMASLFEDYTGMKASPSNIQKAFQLKVLTLSNYWTRFWRKESLPRWINCNGAKLQEHQLAQKEFIQTKQKEIG